MLRVECGEELERARAAVPELHIQAHYLIGSFARSLEGIQTLLALGAYTNIIYNLDQYGYSGVDLATITALMQASRSTEIFFTFAIQAMLSFLSPKGAEAANAQLRRLGLMAEDIADPEFVLSKRQWLGAAERIIFQALAGCAPYVSPFSINNPNGWRYWLIHFANSYRARQVYNDVLHANSGSQAHVGRAGLNMLGYDPRDDDSMLYLFDTAARAAAKEQLLVDVPKIISDDGDAVRVIDFYERIYNVTPAHSDDIHDALIMSGDVRIVTKNGGERRKGSSISPEDVVKLKNQRTFFPSFLKRT